VTVRQIGTRALSITFVIPVRSDAVGLMRCLTAIAATPQRDMQVDCVVADNGSADGSLAVARAFGARVLSFPSLTVAALRNRAATVTARDLLAFVDADHEIGPGWLAAVADVFADQTVGAAGALYLAPPSGTWTQRLYGALRGRTRGHGDTFWLGSGNLVVRRSLFEAVGGFDERLRTCEDVDLCHRIRASGARVVADERLVSVHFGDPKTLRELFLAERWRGRDNLRVSFRTRPSLRDLPSIFIPLVDALCLVVVGAALVAMPFVGRAAWVVAVAALLVVVAFAALRAVWMVMSGAVAELGDWARTLAVALVYDVARACALLLPAGHRREKRPAVDLATGRTP
jgi:GT2 family glycosyltransferase